LLTLTLAVAFTPLAAGCGGEEPTGAKQATDTGQNTIVGSWTATSLTAPSQPGWGDAVVDDGLLVRLTFDESSRYWFSVSNDDPADPWLCDNAASCAWRGTYSTSGDTVVFDEGAGDERSADYSMSGDTLTLTFEATATLTDPYKYVLRRN
jgi:hypothetical protein